MSKFEDDDRGPLEHPGIGETVETVHHTDEGPDDDHVVDVDHVETAEPMPEPAKGTKNNRRVVAGVFGAVFLGLVGVVGWSFFGAMLGGPVQQSELERFEVPVQDVPVAQAVQPAPAVQAAQPEPAQQIASKAQAIQGSTTPQGQAVAFVAQADGLSPAQQSASSASIAVTGTQPQQAGSPVSTQDLERVALALSARIDRLVNEVDELRQQQQRVQQAKLAAPQVAKARSPAADARRTPTRSATKPSDDARDAQAAPARAVAQQAMEGFSLRAVYPPAGPDMQAWVMEGESLRIVSKGSTIAGAVVVDVQSDRVVTERGIIR